MMVPQKVYVLINIVTQRIFCLYNWSLMGILRGGDIIGSKVMYGTEYIETH